MFLSSNANERPEKSELRWVFRGQRTSSAVNDEAGDTNVKQPKKANKASSGDRKNVQQQKDRRRLNFPVVLTPFILFIISEIHDIVGYKSATSLLVNANGNPMTEAVLRDRRKLVFLNITHRTSTSNDWRKSRGGDVFWAVTKNDSTALACKADALLLFNHSWGTHEKSYSQVRDRANRDATVLKLDNLLRPKSRYSSLSTT